VTSFESGLSSGDYSETSGLLSPRKAAADPRSNYAAHDVGIDGAGAIPDKDAS
jgi:hypothetical protein